MYRIKNK